jgi:hypothetical protein
MMKTLLATTAAVALAAGMSIAAAQGTGGAPGAGGTNHGQMQKQGGAEKGGRMGEGAKGGSEQMGRGEEKGERTGQKSGEQNERTGQKSGEKNERTGQKPGEKNERTGQKSGEQNERTGQKAGEKNERTGQGAQQPGRTSAERQGGGNSARISEAKSVHLSSEQRDRIKTVVTANRAARIDNVNFDVRVGVVVPRSVQIVALPEEIVTLVPQYRGFDYILVRDEILIIDPVTLEIVAVLPAERRIATDRRRRRVLALRRLFLFHAQGGFERSVVTTPASAAQPALRTRFNPPAAPPCRPWWRPAHPWAWAGRPCCRGRSDARSRRRVRRPKESRWWKSRSMS